MALVNASSVEEETKKYPELKKSDLEMLRDWLKKQPHLPAMSDSEITLFLHGNYYRTEPTKKKIDTFFTLRTHVPEFFAKRDPVGAKELRQAMEVVCCIPLPGTTPEGYKVLYGKVIDTDTSRYVHVDVTKLLTMAVELWLRAAGSSPGHVVIIDMNGTVFGHLARINPMVANKVLFWAQEALPIRLKAVHIMNTLPFMDLFINIARPFMKKELMDILFLHSNLESLAKKIPVDILPDDQGGKAGPLKDLWAAEVRKIEEHRGWFSENEERKANEILRPDKAKNAMDLFGVQGSFKKLDID